jgi:hypothetical protein
MFDVMLSTCRFRPSRARAKHALSGIQKSSRSRSRSASASLSRCLARGSSCQTRPLCGLRFWYST